jgi:hypothetical protein
MKGMSTVYMVIDFECFQPNLWQSVGIILYEKTAYGGNLLRKLHVSCDRGATIAPSTKAFWKRNHDAFLYNYSHGKDQDVSEQEVAICQFIDHAKEEFPTFYLIGDTPEYDIGLVNNILVRHGRQIMSHRNKDVYLRSICTWSSKKILSNMGIVVTPWDILDIDALYHDLVPHTPIMDCYRVLNEYLCILETTQQNHARCTRTYHAKSGTRTIAGTGRSTHYKY